MQRAKIQQLMQQKKRRRIPSENEDDSILIERRRRREAEQQAEQEHQEAEVVQIDEDDENEENRVQFEEGSTQREEMSLWYKGYRFLRIRKGGTRWRCTERKCSVYATLEDRQQLTGFIDRGDHGHGTAPALQAAELARARMKARVAVDKKVKTAKVRTEERAPLINDNNDDAFFMAGSDGAINRMIQRKKSKFLGHVNRENPLLIQIPPELLQVQGESVLIYDSRVARPNEPDVVLVFSHSRLLRLLETNPRWSIDGTFKAAPAPWTQVFCIGCYTERRNKLVVAAQALLPSKKSQHYIEALEAVKQHISQQGQPERIMRDFEVSMRKAVRQVFPLCQQCGCNFHFGQCQFKKATKMGIFHLDDTWRSFRKLLALALIPTQHVRRAMAFIVNEAPPGMQAYFAWFARNYIGHTQFEDDRGADAFTPGADAGRLFLRRTRSLTPSVTNTTAQSASFVASFQSSTSAAAASFQPSTSSASVRPYAVRRLVDISTSSDSTADTTIQFQFGRHSPQPSTPTMSSIASAMQVIRRWESAIVKQPRFPIDEWNVHTRAMQALERTNNGMEAAHGQFQKELNFHPKLSDFLDAFCSCVDHQCDIAKAAQLGTSRKRALLYELKDAYIVEELETADYDTDEGLKEVLNMLAVLLQKFAMGLHIRGNNNESEDSSDEDEN